jgi:ABC-type transporter MlaC component
LGASQAFTITPNRGYRIADVKVDGVSIGSTSSYLFGNVMSNHTIDASFVPINRNHKR